MVWHWMSEWSLIIGGEGILGELRDGQKMLMQTFLYIRGGAVIIFTIIAKHFKGIEY